MSDDRSRPLDEIERKAASILTEQWHGQDTIELAEMLLLVMPVVRRSLLWRGTFAIRLDEMDHDDMEFAEVIDTMRRGLGKPITEAEVKQALAQGRIERKIAEGDHAWRSLVDRNEALTQQLSAMTAARDELADIAVANTPNTDPHDSFHAYPVDTQATRS